MRQPRVVAEVLSRMAARARSRSGQLLAAGSAAGRAAPRPGLELGLAAVLAAVVPGPRESNYPLIRWQLNGCARSVPMCSRGDMTVVQI